MSVPMPVDLLHKCPSEVFIAWFGIISKVPCFCGGIFFYMHIAHKPRPNCAIIHAAFVQCDEKLLSAMQRV